MKKTTKITLSVVAVVLAVGLIGWRLSQKSGQSSTFKIGAIFSLTGDLAIYGEDLNRGALIAVDQAKKEGVDISYIAEDDSFEPAKSVSAAEKLLELDGVDAALTSWAPEVKPTAPLFNQRRVPLLSIWDNTGFMKTAGPYIFTIGFSAEADGEKMAEFAYDNLKLRRIVIVHHVEEWSQLISQSFAKKFQDMGGQVVINQGFQLDDTDFRSFTAKIKNIDADGIYMPFNPPANSIFLTQAKQVGFRGKFLSADGFTQDEINTAGNAADGVYFTNIYADNVNDLIQQYKTRYHTDPASAVFVSLGYDGVNVLIEASKIAEEKNIPLRDALTMVKIQGTGALIDMNGKQYADRIEKIYQVIKGTSQLAE